MKPQLDRPAVCTPAGNLAERAAQIQRFQERLDRIGGTAHQVAAELVVLARDIKTLPASQDVVNPSPVSSRNQENWATNPSV
jgi:hypothetical protein